MLKLADVFQSGMVVQREKSLAVWGMADAGKTVSVAIQNQCVSTITDDAGYWQVTLAPLAASENECLTITCADESIVFDDVAVGEVWLAGGQSNMEFFMRYEKHINEVKPGCANQRIRFFDVPEIAFDEQKEGLDYSRMSIWRKATLEDIDYFSAVGYYFGRVIEKSLDVPVGIIGCNWGGTVSAAWMHPDTVKKVGPGWQAAYDAFAADVDWAQYWDKQVHNLAFYDNGNPFANPFNEFFMPKTPTEAEIQIYQQAQDIQIGEKEYAAKDIPGCLYAHMVKTVAPFGIRGVLWYQGESDEDHGFASLYQSMLEGLIGDWRALWADQLPFLIVQLPGFERWLDVENKEYAVIRQAQAAVTETVQDTWLCSISDIGERWDIHPKNKLQVGERLALLARRYVYGHDIPADAPSMQSVDVKNQMIMIHFAHAEGGLKLIGDKVEALCVYDGDQMMDFEFEIRESDLILKLCSVPKEMLAIRFAKEAFYQVNLYNSAGVPAIPFEYVWNAEA